MELILSESDRYRLATSTSELRSTENNRSRCTCRISSVIPCLNNIIPLLAGATGLSTYTENNIRCYKELTRCLVQHFLTSAHTLENKVDFPCTQFNQCLRLALVYTPSLKTMRGLTVLTCEKTDNLASIISWSVN